MQGTEGATGTIQKPGKIATSPDLKDSRVSVVGGLVEGQVCLSRARLGPEMLAARAVTWFWGPNTWWSGSQSTDRSYRVHWAGRSQEEGFFFFEYFKNHGEKHNLKVTVLTILHLVQYREAQSHVVRKLSRTFPSSKLKPCTHQTSPSGPLVLAPGSQSCDWTASDT